ncbi:AMP-binding protein [uncultured Methylobacterium sp.]|uniref:AMP-binding protein n=1 Tax=uncultured Methylobacterium sp. TaxID=157278 RepID=UPI0035CA0475
MNRAPTKLAFTDPARADRTPPTSAAAVPPAASLTASRADAGASISGGRSHRYARWALQEGLAEGDTVALLMRNQPDVLAIWQGLAAIGVAAALLDPGLRGADLARVLAAARPRQLIVDAGLAEAFGGVQGLIPVRLAVWWHGDGADFARIDREVEEYEERPLDGHEVAGRRDRG